MRNIKGKTSKKSAVSGEAGVSMIEMLVVLVIIGILATTSIFYLTAYQKLYKPDDQALKIVDIIQEARQRSLTERRTMRVEVDLTSNSVKLIDELDPLTAADDKIINQLSLFATTDVKVNPQPANVTTSPPETFPIPAAQFSSSQHPLSAGHNVCTVRFLRDGSVVNAGTNDVGLGAFSTGLTLFIWSPKKGAAGSADITRAITIIGTTGSIKFWEYDPNATTNKWKDSRRVGYVFGGTGGSSNGNSNSNSNGP